jgi:CheY-like chemotaxis protein
MEVSDTGCGIGLEAQARLFDPFFTTKPAGHGLGLAVVHRIVRGVLGSIHFDTEVGRGTTFSIRLPACDVAAPAAPVGVSSTEEVWTGATTVLVVEDETPLRAAVVKMLRRTGLTVIEAADGTAALDLVRDPAQPIDVVLLDITLPGDPSRDVLAETRRLRPSTRTIVTSAYGQSQVDASFPGMEIDAFIRKPFLFADLLALLRRFVPAGSFAAATFSAGGARRT